MTFNRQLFSQKAPSWMFDKVLNTPLFNKSLKQTNQTRVKTKQHTSCVTVLETLEKP